jgi:hypothetical protein
MKNFNAKGFTDRLDAAAKAKQENLKRFAQRPAPDDPAEIERQAARLAVAELRRARAAKREEEKAAEKLRKAEEEAERAAEQLREAALAVERAAALELERKAARDQRYAARKMRK